MKKTFVRLVTVTIFLFSTSHLCVRASLATDSGIIVPVSDGNTTTLIFHAAIKAVDRGSSQLLAQKMNDTILKIKAAVKDMAATNLNVVTSDGKLHFFKVYYDSTTAGLPVDIGAQQPSAASAIVPAAEPTEMHVARLAVALGNQKAFLRGPGTRTENMAMRIGGLYFDQGILYIQLRLANYSALPYKIDFIRTAIKDRQTRKRKTQQETELRPLYTNLPELPLLPGKVTSVVLAFPQFSITKEKRIELQLFEASGGRHLKLDLKSRHLLRFKPAAGVANSK